jgi:hydrogenase nickel incorporation protein HypA/HybF
MHEYGLVGELLARVEEIARANGASKVARVRVKLGALAGVEPSLFRAAFETFRERTICAEAELTVIDAPPRWECPRCGRAIPEGTPLRCCGKPARLASGDELLLDRVELSLPEGTANACK